MKIFKVQAELIAPPNLDGLRVTLLNESGVSGSAEARLAGRAPAITGYLSELVRGLIGTDPLDTEALIDRLLTRASGRVGDVESTTVSLVEMACRDLAARALGLPVYQLLGGAVRDRVPACAVGWMPAERTPEEVSRAAGGLVARGFRTLAFTPFGPASAAIDSPPSPTLLREAVRLTEVVRAAVGPEVSLRVDFHARFLPSGATRALRRLERADPTAVADPVRAEHLPVGSEISVCAGHGLNLRDDFFRVLSRRGCDTIRLDLTRCGGYTEARKIAALAESQGVSVSLHNLPGPAATAAALQLAATLVNVAYVEVEPYPDLMLFEGALPLPAGSATSRIDHVASRDA